MQRFDFDGGYARFIDFLQVFSIKKTNTQHFLESDPILQGKIDSNFEEATVMSLLVTNDQPQLVVGKMSEDVEIRKYSKHFQSFDHLDTASNLKEWMLSRRLSPHTTGISLN